MGERFTEIPRAKAEWIEAMLKFGILYIGDDNMIHVAEGEKHGK